MLSAQWDVQPRWNFSTDGRRDQVYTTGKLSSPNTSQYELTTQRYLLLTSSITMGGIGIWCMHFIGNRAIVLGNGDANLQILYNVAFTGTSFALPVAVLLFAFYAVGVEEKAGYGRILIGGLLTGSSVCGMHYVGQLGISNYRCSYNPANVAGSAIIAIFSSTLALGIFFRWRASWTDSWWRRGLCACMLAAAVSGMHWTAAVGTAYKDHNRHIVNGTQLSRSQVVIVCSVLVRFTFVMR
jgi:NO-binding membrane sensor protein with MHYT domain